MGVMFFGSWLFGLLGNGLIKRGDFDNENGGGYSAVGLKN